MKNSFVVFFGLDRNIDDNIFENLTENHPQFMLSKLLNNLKITRSDVIDLEFKKFKQRDDNLSNLLSYSFVPLKNQIFGLILRI